MISKKISVKCSKVMNVRDLIPPKQAIPLLHEYRNSKKFFLFAILNTFRYTKHEHQDKKLRPMKKKENKVYKIKLVYHYRIFFICVSFSFQ